MYQHDPIGHGFSIFNVAPTSRAEVLFRAPPITLGNTFIYRTFHFVDDNQRENSADSGIRYDSAHQLADLATDQHLCLKGNVKANDVPILLSCATERNSLGVEVDLSPESIPWKLCHCILTAKRLELRFINLDVLRDSLYREYATLILNDVAILQMDCHIIYGLGKHTHSEHYTCITNPCTPESHLLSFRVEYQNNSLLKTDQDPTHEITTSQIKCTFEDSYR